MPYILGKQATYRNQAEIALSTTEAEHIALSMTTQELLPLHYLIQKIHDNG
jgi:hypothetical protein